MSYRFLDCGESRWSGVGKPKRRSRGFSADKPAEAPNQQITKSSADHAAKEQQAVALVDQGKLQDAEAIYKDLISIGTSNHIVYGNLAAICLLQSRHDESISLLQKAIQLNPNDPDTYINLGNALQEQGELTPAIASYNTALQLKPSYPEAHNNLGTALQEQGELTAAIASFNKALQLNPNDPDAHNNLGTALQEQGELTAAVASFKRALQLNPNDPDAHHNLGRLLKEQGNLDAAIASFKKALQLNPNNPDAHWNSSLTMLLGGDYKNGWEKYEWRTKIKTNISQFHAVPKCDQLTSEHSLKTTSHLLLVTEQGLGDTLQFMRYTTALRNEGISVSICAQTKLHNLIKTSGIDPSPLTPQQANEVSEGQWMPLLSVPRYLEVSPEKPIITEPYIKTTKELKTKWAGILTAEQRPIIGINWQGNPKAEKTGLWGRSLALETFAPIAHLTNASLLSLQKGFGSEQIETCSFKDRFVSCQDQINETWDFLETAAIIANCDLVITSDTSVAHLAGGMGKTTWLLLHKVPDWRWGLEGDTTFWYPSMRLFRQKERGNWNEVMERVAVAIQEYFGNSSVPTQPAKDLLSAIKPEPIQDILAPISLGELIDKITILQIKTQNLQGTALGNVKKELEALESTLNKLQIDIDSTLIQRLQQVNQALWQIEDDIRDKEHNKDFGDSFVSLARSVYQQNDRRADIKKEINTTYGSSLTEEKSYTNY